MLECPNLLATLAIETPANSKRDACVCRNPCIEIIDIPAFLQCLSRIELISLIFSNQSALLIPFVVRPL